MGLQLPLGDVGASPRSTGDLSVDSPRMAGSKELSKEYSGLGMFADKGFSGLAREVSWGLMKESSGLAGGLLDNVGGE